MDKLIVSDKHIVDKYKPSPDMEGLCMILSVNFFHEIIKNVRDVNSLFIFSRSHPVIGLTTKEQETFKEYFHVIKHKIGDQDNFFRKDLIRTLLLAMFYDVGNIIYRFKETDSHPDQVHQDGGGQLPSRASCGMVCPTALHHPQVPLGDGEGRQ